MNNSLNFINTNISAISRAKSIVLDTSYRKNNSKRIPSSNQINLSKKKKNEQNLNNITCPIIQKKLFSLLDIKPKFRSKAPNLPNQYKRKIYSNLDYYLYEKNSKQNLSQIPQIESYGKKEEKKILKKINLKKSQSRRERLYRPISWDNYDINEIKKEQKDKLKPEGFEFHQKNSILNNKQNYIKNNYVKLDPKKSFILIRKMNKLKAYKSNIFFSDNDENNKINLYKKEIASDRRREMYKKYKDSDIFNLRNDKNIIEKSGEHSFLSGRSQIQDNNIYNHNSETLSCWRLRKPLPGFINYPSSQFDLFNRDMKNVSRTKENLLEEVQKLSESFNPTHKQKGLTEYIHLSRADAPNNNQDYLNAFNNNPNVFRRRNEFSSEFFDIYNKYNSLCEKPFAKFNILKVG